MAAIGLLTTVLTWVIVGDTLNSQVQDLISDAKSGKAAWLFSPVKVNWARPQRRRSVRPRAAYQAPRRAPFKSREDREIEAGCWVTKGACVSMDDGWHVNGLNLKPIP